MIFSSGLGVVVLDLETAKSADDCLHCGQSVHAHLPHTPQSPGRKCFAGSTSGRGFEAIGWDNKLALGLRIGCYYDYRDDIIHWFDVHTLEEMVRRFVETAPLLVSFNGIRFDFPLICELLKSHANSMLREEITNAEYAYESNAASSGEMRCAALVSLCDTFAVQSALSYDILNEIWKVDPVRKFARGLNSLDAIARANGLGGKLGHGADAPRQWGRAEYARVLNYCQDDVLKTKALFEQIVHTGSILRGDNVGIRLPNPLSQT